MKRLIFAISVLVTLIVCVGFYRGWFTVNEEKIQQDEKRAKEEVRELMQEVKEKAGNRAKPAKEPQ